VSTMSHVWRWKCRLGERHGTPCKVLAVGSLNSALVEFMDGYKVVTSRYAVRRAHPAPGGREGANT
jgi:hypothetical protein